MINAREIASRLTTIESLAIIPRVASTNLIARRIVNECIENDLSLPQAMIIAREQFAGRGRNQRSWSSPAGKGIYATTLLMRTTVELPVLPLAIANLVAGYLQDTFALEARIKWPNDILVGGRKIAGILMEARVSESRAFVVIGIGINAEPVQDDTRPNAVSIREVAGSKYVTVDSATVDFVHYVDRGVARPFIPSEVLTRWRLLTIHKNGDPISSLVGDNMIEGRWAGIDDYGRALLTTPNGETLTVSAGDLLI